jgi:hypothetical protein
MNYLRIIVSFTLSVVLFSFSARSGGSSYSRYGFGDIIRYGDSRIYAMGGTGIAFMDEGCINFLNPAGMARISYTRFSTGFEYDRFTSRDDQGSSVYTSGGFHGLAFAIPLSRENGIVLSVEATPYSKVDYAIRSSIQDTMTGSMQNIVSYGSGGLSYLGLGLSFSPFNTLHIGGRLNYLYGRTRQYQTTSFNSDILSATTFDQSIYYSGFAFTFGTIFDGFDQILGLPSLHNVSLGFTLRTAASLDADAEKIYVNSDTTVAQKGIADLPLSLGFGLAYLHQGRYRFLGDFVIENWGELKSFTLDPVQLRNSFRGSIGFELVPHKTADTYWKRVFYRAGIAYNTTYYQINGTGIDELSVTGGLGLPLGPDSWLNIGLQVGMRGATTNKLQKDTIVRLSIAVSASEIWFLQFDEE